MSLCVEEGIAAAVIVDCLLDGEGQEPVASSRGESHEWRLHCGGADGRKVDASRDEDETF